MNVPPKETWGESRFGLTPEEFAAKAATISKYMPEIPMPSRWWYVKRWLKRWL